MYKMIIKINLSREVFLDCRGFLIVEIDCSKLMGGSEFHRRGNLLK